METHSPSLPPLHSGDKKNSPVLLSEQFVAGDEQHRLSLHGGHPHSPNIVFFLCSCRCLALGVFAPVTPLPPDGFVLVRWEGGLCGDFCACRSPLPAAWRVGRATWSIDFLLEKNPSSDIITRCLYACIHVRTHCHSLTALSLYLHHL